MVAVIHDALFFLHQQKRLKMLSHPRQLLLLRRLNGQPLHQPPQQQQQQQHNYSPIRQQPLQQLQQNPAEYNSIFLLNHHQPQQLRHLYPQQQQQLLQ